ncbi:hypothetical protein HCH_00371 [Hahella chejuensis KCTC 2396]|uniref:Uncharacterized protein n=1 Tax=Hahella chejuensis (strain KCTC 2396) TaxID=349521 RepID=Q2SPZ2_HAHCH|nr:hypothetical protein [Hahella chejuensis]ABC27282.1 hypothetical protein HCH_00371 [Hahella chejuensis KCTC 2396]
MTTYDVHESNNAIRFLTLHIIKELEIKHPDRFLEIKNDFPLNNKVAECKVFIAKLLDIDHDFYCSLINDVAKKKISILYRSSLNIESVFDGRLYKIINRKSYNNDFYL